MALSTKPHLQVSHPHLWGTVLAFPWPWLLDASPAVPLSHEIAPGTLQHWKVGVLVSAEKQFAPDCGYQPVLWLALGWVRALKAAGTWRCSHGQHYFHSSKFQEGEWKLQITQSAVFDQLMNAHDSRGLDFKPQNPLLACYPPETNWLYFIKDLNCKFHLLEEKSCGSF